MCTAISFSPAAHYFGRTLDLDVSYHEEVVVTPRGYPFVFRNGESLPRHHAIIGMATVQEGYPLYYDATNERGLSAAALNFPGNACYREAVAGRENIAPFELIPWLLSRCATVAEARPLLRWLNLWEVDFSPSIPLFPLHWMLADRREAVVIEQTKKGLFVHENPIGVLTNNPPFDWQLQNLHNYLNLTAKPPVSRFAEGVELTPYSFGMGAIGLPGDLSSPSRFVRAAFTKANSRCAPTEEAAVAQFFHIMDTVAQTKGCTEMAEGHYEITRYTSCCNTDRGIYYYTTYENRGITAVDLHRAPLDGETLYTYPLLTAPAVTWQNR